jgi:TonB family protein
MALAAAPAWAGGLPSAIGALFERLGGQETACPADPVPPAGIGSVRCAAVAPDLGKLRREVDRFLRDQGPANAATRVADWRVVDGRDAVTIVVGSRAFTLLYEPETRRLRVQAARGCLGSPGGALPGLEAGDLAELERVEYVRPDFPAPARARRLDGLVVVQALVRADGRVGEACVMGARPAGYGYEEAALAAIERWRYAPARSDGSPVDRAIAVIVHFEIR